MRGTASSAALHDMLRSAIVAGRTGVLPLEDAVMTVPASSYVEPARHQLEVDRIFKRLPLMLAATAELPNPGDYKTIDAVGVPVLISRQADGTIKAYVNSCTHRGAKLATERFGAARRFVCPYHGWSFGQKGDLLAVSSASEFGVIDKACYALTALPAAERAGLIWVTLDRGSNLDIDAFLAGYDDLLARFDFANWHVFAHDSLVGPNWKAAYDGYHDFYHVSVLHKDTIGKGLGNQAIFSAWGPHQRLIAPARNFAELEAMAESEWPEHILMGGVWTIFPHVSIASFSPAGLGGCMVSISQLFPGETVGESRTEQIYLLQNPPDEAQAQIAERTISVLHHVVEGEDYGTVRALHRGLVAGSLDRVTFGRNEGGGQRLHQWIDRIVATSDGDLQSLFKSADADAGEARSGPSGKRGSLAGTVCDTAA